MKSNLIVIYFVKVIVNSCVKQLILEKKIEGKKKVDEI